MTERSFHYPTDEEYRAIAERARREKASVLRTWLHDFRHWFELPDFGPDTPEPRRP